ncbi:hypothetical protein NAF17_07035 [Mucilaginibacter sp. RB4R14]|uniref:hypothetical protein n=1 Tax=Mucilaginibacter aurantiaciroseus TaxID=2949308 RepID=UPI00209054C0|nr:hypothetical protein [Mucilaginibacter aurantiaciroseus]MCO5935289.1 hypothetical protein [Mucilaginibacter aurantiaciroseus]
MKITMACLSLLFCTDIVLAQNISRPLQIGVSSGYECHNFDWSIAGNVSGQNPNVYSELKWKGISGPAVSATVQYTFWKKFSGMASYSRLIIRLGRVTDNDYNGDNRTNPTYDETFNSNRGNMYQWNVGLGYELINNEKFSLVPFAGYETSRQLLSILDLTGDFPELNSNYVPLWKGLFIKCLAQVRLNSAFKIIADVSYNQSHYTATADWNVIQTFEHPVSYRHTANGYRINTNASLSYSVAKNVAINIGGGYLAATTGTGIDELYLSSGGSEKTQLNGINSAAYRLVGGIVLSY